MKFISDLIEEVRQRRDITIASDEEILEYFNDIEAQLSESVFPRFSLCSVNVEPGKTKYDISALVDDPRKIIAVYVDGKRTLQCRDAYDILDGWYEHNGEIVISDGFADCDEIVLYCRSASSPHKYSDIDIDRDFLIPAAYHDLYIFYALSQIAAKEADEASYRNYKEDYNSLLSEAIAVTTKRQLFPNYTL